jgi:hypothetical protein
MARTKSALGTQIIPAWHEFVAGLVPDGVKSQAAAGASPYPARAIDANSSPAVYFRRILSGEIGQPQPRKVWEIARGARSLGPGFEWCAGPLFLFAAGHFDYFAKLMVSIGDAIPKTRLREMISDVGGAVTAAEPEDDNHANEQLARELRQIDSMRWTDFQKQRVKRIARARSSRPPIYDEERTWILSGLEEVAFDEAFERIVPDGGGAPKSQISLLNDVGPNWKRGRLDLVREKHPAVVTAILVTEHPEIGLEMQRNIVLNSLLQRMWLP